MFRVVNSTTWLGFFGHKGLYSGWNKIWKTLYMKPTDMKSILCTSSYLLKRKGLLEKMLSYAQFLILKHLFGNVHGVPGESVPYRLAFQPCTRWMTLCWISTDPRGVIHIKKSVVKLWNAPSVNTICGGWFCHYRARNIIDSSGPKRPSDEITEELFPLSQPCAMWQF